MKRRLLGLACWLLALAGALYLYIGNGSGQTQRTWQAPSVAAPVVTTGNGFLCTSSSVSAVRVGLAAPLVTVSFDGSTITPPDDTSEAGQWFAETGADQPTVILGHVSDNLDVPGAFSLLKDVRLGDDISTCEIGQTAKHWTVTRIWSTSKSDLPVSVFADDHGLRLMTCTGRQQIGSYFHYAENLVVEATPVSLGSVNGVPTSTSSLKDGQETQSLSGGAVPAEPSTPTSAINQGGNN